MMMMTMMMAEAWNLKLPFNPRATTGVHLPLISSLSATFNCTEIILLSLPSPSLSPIHPSKAFINTITICIDMGTTTHQDCHHRLVSHPLTKSHICHLGVIFFLCGPNEKAKIVSKALIDCATQQRVSKF